MIKKSSSYINCENLQNNSTFIKHFKSVQLDNNSDDHIYKNNLTRDSSCSNYSFNKTYELP